MYYKECGGKKEHAWLCEKNETQILKGKAIEILEAFGSF